MIWWIMWLSLALLLLVIEFLTVDLVSVWFSGASLLTAIVTAIFPELHWAWQVLIFALLSAGLLIATRPLVKAFLKKHEMQATNLELIIGQVAVVEEDVDNDLSQGAVKLNGLVWSARTETGERLKKGTFVIVQKIDGNKVIVTERKILEEK